MQPLWFSLCARPLRALFCVLLLACALLQSKGQNLKYLSQQAWSTEEGLPQSSVHSIVQTPDGYLWLATEGGLVRFDGFTFLTFDRGNQPAFTSDDVCCLAVDRNGLWIGTADGVLRLQQGQFHRYSTDDGLVSSTIDSIHVTGEGALFVETADGWSQWDQTKFKPLQHAPGELEANEAGTVALPENSSWRFSSTLVSDGARQWRVGEELPSGRVQTVMVDREGLAWVGMNGGLFVLSADKPAATPVTLLNGNSVLSLFEDSEGNHWVGTETSGLHILRRLAFRSEAALADQAVTSVVQTKDGSIWVGTRDAGLRRVRTDGQEDQIPESKLTSAVILCLAPEWTGGLWVGTPDGLNYIDASGSVRRITSADGLPDDYIRALVGDSDGSVWVGTRQGLVHVQRFGEHFSIQTLTTSDGLGGDLIGALMFKSGDLWVATSGGLSVVHSDSTIRNYTAGDGLGATIVTAMAEDGGGHLWVAGNDGSLSYFTGERFLHVGKFAEDGAARAGNIEGITADRLGYFWFRMDRGIRRVAVIALTGCVGKDRCTLPNDAMVQYGPADGLPNDEVVAGEPSVGWLTTHGEIWFPTRGGVAIVDSEHLPANAFVPPIVLQRFSVDDISEPIGANSIKIPFGHARFTMEYAGLSFTAPTEVQYRFRLDGFDKNWTDAGNRRSATYTNLTPGRYLFHVEARTKDGAWNRAGAELRFRIVPPIYRRWWFLLLTLILLLALVAGIYLLRLRRLEREFDAVLAERNRMAREIHDTLTQDFVGASLQLDLITQHLNRGKFELALEQVKRTRQLVTEGLEEARRSIWEMRVNNSQDSLPTRLSKIVQRDTFSSIHPRLHVGGAYRVVDPKVERELLRIAQEALSNVLHHAQSAETSVELHYSSDMLMLTIEDKGIGFRVNGASGKTGHYGLLGMKERSATIDGTLEVTSEPGRGTKVTLRVPIAEAAR